MTKQRLAFFSTFLLWVGCSAGDLNQDVGQSAADGALTYADGGAGAAHDQQAPSDVTPDQVLLPDTEPPPDGTAPPPPDQGAQPPPDQGAPLPPPTTQCGGKTYTVQPDRLMPNQMLVPGQSVTSQNGGYSLVMQPDGNLVLYKGGKALWSSNTGGKAVSKAVMQCDGNLVVYGFPKALWESKTAGSPGAYLVVQDDGNTVIYKPHVALWSSKTVVAPGAAAASGILPGGGQLTPGQSLHSGDKRFRLAMQPDGNLVVYDGAKALWHSNTGGKAVSKAAMQTDGNFVIYGYPTALWSTGTAGHPSSYLAMQADGNLVVYQKAHPIWATNTAQP
jgi:hypothetical protein